MQNNTGRGQGGKVPCPPALNRNRRVDHILIRAAASRFKGEKEKAVIAAIINLGDVYRPAGRDAEFVANQLRRLTVVVGTRTRLSDTIVAGRLERRAM